MKRQGLKKSQRINLQRDFKGAKKFALKARNLFPMLDGLSQFLDVLNVFAAQGNIINGEIDCYGILGVDPCAEEELIRKQYKRLALSLHPDKNKSVGADGAFKILSEAWSVLSDKDKRRAYDMKMNLRAPSRSSSQPCFSSSHHHKNMASGAQFQYPPSHQWAPVAAAAASVSQYDPGPCHPVPGSSPVGRSPATADSQYGPPQPTLYPTGDQQSSSRFPPIFPTQQQTSPPASAAPFFPAARPTFRSRYTPKNQSISSTSPSITETFWTRCNRCSAHYEYEKFYLNKHLLCKRCQQPFLSAAIPHPNANHHTSPGPRQQQDPGAASGVPSSMPPLVTRTCEAVHCHPSSEHAKRRHEMEANLGCDHECLMKNSFTVPENMGTGSAPCTGLSRGKPVKRRRKDGLKCDSSRGGSQGKARYPAANRASENVKGSSGEREQSRRTRELSQVILRAMLMQKAKAEILERLNQWQSGREHIL